MSNNGQQNGGAADDDDERIESLNLITEVVLLPTTKKQTAKTRLPQNTSLVDNNQKHDNKLTKKSINTSRKNVINQICNNTVSFFLSLFSLCISIIMIFM